MEVLSTWELFLLEIKRNISPKKDEIENQFIFLKEKNLYDESTYNKLIEVRYIAAFEAAIVEFLHPPIEWKIGNVKAEILHLGTIYEGLLVIIVKNLEKNGKIMKEELIKIKKDYTSPEKLTFIQLIKIMNSKNLFSEIIKKIDEVREERNKIHLTKIAPTSQGEVSSEEFRAIEYRLKLDRFLEEIKNIF